MYKMMRANTCNNCNTRWNTKKTYDLHVSMCNLIHKTAKERDIDREIEIPSSVAMFQYIIHLTNKYEELEKKVAKIQTTTTRLRRKHIDEYLQNIHPPKMEYNDWLSSIEVVNDHLQIVFDHDLEECIRHVLTPLLSDLPIRAFTQKTAVFYIYDASTWRIMKSDEFASFVTSISRKVLRTYTKWAKDHYEEMHATAKMQELGMVYMGKVNGMNHSADARSISIKKWLFSKIAVSLNDVDF